MNYTYQLIRSDDTESYADFKSRIFSALNSLESEPAELKVTLTEEKPPALSVIPFGKSKIAAIRFGWNDPPPPNPLANMEGRSGSFIVHEALPVAYEMNWETGTRTPGVCLLTLFRKREDISYETFLERWHYGHTPLSLKIHPLWHYSRNVVNDKWGDEDAWYDGIVEEHCRSRSELLNPAKFFKNPIMMLPNMIRVYFDVRSFLDYPAVEPYYTAEYILKKAAG